jgi:hypothetical protein
MNRISFAVAAVLAAHVVPAHAERPGVIFSQTVVPTVKVTASANTSYNHISGKTYPLGAQLSGYCPSGVHGASVRTAGVPGNGDAVDTSDLRSGDKRVSLRPVLVPYSLTPIEWPAKWRQAVFAACNDNAVKQMNSRHLTAQQVLARDWNLGEVRVDTMTALLVCDDDHHAGIGFDSSGVPTYDMDAAARVKVICGKSKVDDFAAPTRPKTPTQDLTYGVHVVQSNLAILPKTGGSGPCGVTLSGMVETDAINTTVTFFYRNNKGGTTPWRSVKTDHSKTAFFSDFIDFGKPSAGGFVSPVAGPSGPAAGTFAAPHSTKDFSGTYQIVGKNITFQSNIQNFSFDCAAPPINGVASKTAAPIKPVPPRVKKAP